ncbi:hypothetical protein JCM6882_000015 [Rhodosporidiobolus microsporus]
MPQLNTVDLSAFLAGAPVEEQKAVAQAFVDNAARVGFFYVTGWESVVPKELVAEVFEFNKRFFDLPLEKKDALAYVSSKANRGYLSFGREQASLSKDPNQIESEREANKDQKETFEIGNDIDPQYPEHWPNEEDIPGFKAALEEGSDTVWMKETLNITSSQTMNRFHLACHDLHMRIMTLLALSLNLSPSYFDSQVDSRNHCLRLLHYPPASRSGSASRLGAHTDFGTTTLLWQDETGGLEIEGPDGQWVPVTPKPDSFVINFGDVLARWSNDRLKSTVHRGRLPDLKEGEDPNTPVKTRRSVAYFCNPNPDTLIKCIPGLENADGTSKYEPVLAADFYAALLEAEIGV